MPLMWIVLVLALITGIWLSIQSDHVTSSTKLIEVDTLAGGLLFYRSSLAECTHANPGLIGLPAGSALGPLAWFHRPARLQGCIVAGTSYALIVSPPAGLAATVDTDAKSDLVGIRHSGQLVTCHPGATAITLPAPIPEDAVVVVK